MKKLFTLIFLISTVHLYAQNCDPLDTFFDDFESYPAGSGEPLPPCWNSISTVALNSTVVGVRNTEGEAYSGTNTILVYTLFTINDETYLITPELSTIDGAHYASFYIKSSGSVLLEYGTMTDNQDVSTYSAVSEPVELTEEYQQITTPNIPENAGHKYFVLKLNAPAIHLATRIDDFSWNVTCNTPANIAVSDITSSSVLISWDENTNAESYIVEYGEEGFAVGAGTIVTSNTNSVELENLNPNTAYDFYLKSNCGDAITSDNSTVGHFTTLEDASQIDIESTNNILVYPNPTNGVFNIENVRGADVEVFNLVGQRVFSAVEVEENISVDLSNLSEGTYVVRISGTNSVKTQKINLVK